MKLKALALAVGMILLAGLVSMVGSASSAEPTTKCADDKEPTTVSVGIVRMKGCWTESGDPVIKTAVLNEQPGYGDSTKVAALDMNGFLLTGVNEQTRITVNTKTSAIRSVKADGSTADDIQLWSIGYPGGKNPVKIGEPFQVNFTPPNQGTMVLEDLKIGSNNFIAKSLAGFSPVSDVETPIILNEDGKGSMDLTVRLTGIFELKGRPQSATIKIPSAVGEGSRIDGFHLHLQEIDGIKLIKINDFEAEYSAEEKKLGGGADFSLPFMNGKGINFAFEIENAILTKMSVGASGLKVPIGAPPGGFITAVSGGFGFKQIDSAFVLNLNAAATAEFGPELPTPWGKVVPIEVNSSLLIGKEGQDFYFHFDGGVKVFRLQVGNVYLKVHTNSGIDFGFSLGIGFPSYRNSPDDPFYIGANVKGWVAKQRFQFSGGGKVRLFGLNIFDGEILINTKAAGACWKVAWVPGGAAYEYGRSVQTFGVTCGLDRYREAYPKATRSGDVVASASQTRRFSTGKRTVIMTVRGRDRAPKFQVHSADGRSFAVPKGKPVVRTKNYMIVSDEKHKVTSILSPRLRNGDWTITPYPGSTPIMGLKTGQVLRPEHVEARVNGRGLSRTLVWNSRGNPHTKLVFTEVMKDGSEQPILTTDKVKGRYRFKASKGSHYGKRRLRAYVVHGGTPRQITIEDRYLVRRPAKLRAPRIVHAWRNVYTATATWKGVRGAHGYVAEIAVRHKGRKVSSYRRVVGPKTHRISIPRHPGGTWAVASVQALNADGVPGKIGTKRFRLAPPVSLTLKQASKRSAANARRAGGKVKLRTLCPINGHCQTKILLVLGKRTVGQRSFQQVPGTYRLVQLAPKNRQLRKRLARGRLNRLRVVVRQHRIASATKGFGSTVNGL